MVQVEPNCRQDAGDSEVEITKTVYLQRQKDDVATKLTGQGKIRRGAETDHDTKGG